jgi:hypothetical protein
MRYMADSVTARDIPVRRFELVAGYVDGIYAWTEADWLLHRSSTLVGIAVNPLSNAGQVLDVETGDATPAESVDWVLLRRTNGQDPTVYVQASRVQEIVDAFAARGVDRPHFWVAAWDGSETLYSYSAAHQYANPTLTGAHYDLSVVVDSWPGVDSTPGCLNPTWPKTLQTYCWSDIDYIIHAYTWAEIQTRYGDAAFPFIWNRAHPGAPVQWPSGSPPAIVPAPVTPPTPSPSAPPLDEARAAWARLGELFVQVVPDAIIRIASAVEGLRKLP